jgi:hypothetical protein
MPVGILSSATRSPDMPSRCLTSARSVLPCETTSTHAPVHRSATIESYQYGSRHSHILQRFSPRPGLRRDDCVAGIGELGVPGAISELRRCGVVRPAPRHVLPLAELRHHLGLVPALQRAVAIGVQPPGPPYRDPVPVTFGQGEVGGADGPALNRCVHQARLQPVSSQQSPSLYRFPLSPASVSGTFIHPVNRFLAFQSL